MNVATVSTNQQHRAINMSSKSMKKPLLGAREAGRDTYSAGKYESHKAEDVYDVLFRARKLITMK